MPYILRLLVTVSKSDAYWTLEKPIDSALLPFSGDTISMQSAYYPNKQALFTVTSTVHYPDRNIGPMIIAKLSDMESVDEAIILIDSIKVHYPELVIHANNVKKPVWYEIYKLVSEFKAVDPRIITEITRSVMVSTNSEIAVKNDLFEPQLKALNAELLICEGDIVRAFCKWGQQVELDGLQIAPEVIQLVVINVTRFLSKARIDASLWPIQCQAQNKS